MVHDNLIPNREMRRAYGKINSLSGDVFVTVKQDENMLRLGVELICTRINSQRIKLVVQNAISVPFHENPATGQIISIDSSYSMEARFDIDGDFTRLIGSAYQTYSAIDDAPTVVPFDSGKMWRNIAGVKPPRMIPVAE